MINPTQTQEYLIELNDQSGVSDNFLKMPNSMFELISGKKDNIPLLDPSEFVLYQYFYKLAYGWKKNYCRVGHDRLATALNMSLSTIKRMIKSIMSKHCVILIEEDKVSKLGSLYFVCNPEEIIGHTYDFTRVNLTRVKMNRVQNELRYPVQIDPSDKTDKITEISAVIESSPTQSKMTKVNLNPIKDVPKDIYKDTLRLGPIIDVFYKGIGHEKITNRKRERAFANCRELEEQGYTSDDISYAVKWTLDNAKSELYDFSIINETISKATTVMHQEGINKQQRLQREQAEEEINRLRELEHQKSEEQSARCIAYKQTMPKDKRDKLRMAARGTSFVLETEKDDSPMLGAAENNILKDNPEWGYIQT